MQHMYCISVYATASITVHAEVRNTCARRDSDVWQFAQMKKMKGLLYFADSDISIVSRLQGVELCLLSAPV